MRRLLIVLAGLLTVAGSLSACASDDDARSLSLEDAVGQMLLIGFRGETLNADVRAMLDEVRPGGVILYDHDFPSEGEAERNIASPEQLRNLISALQDQAHVAYFIAVDAEGGVVHRLKERYGFQVVVPSHQKLGAGTVSETESIVTDLADELAELGINWNFAPVVDVNVVADSPSIGGLERSFSADPEVVAAHAAAFAGALRDGGVIPILKHFPGHGSDTAAMHLGVPDVSETYRRDLELSPYRALIGDGYEEAVFVSHVVNRVLDSSGTPASLSSVIVTGLLRDELSFDGVIVVDDVMYPAIVEQYGLGGAAVAAIQAGADILLAINQSPGYDLDHLTLIKQAILQAVADGEISEERIYESVERILALKRAYVIAE